MNSERNIAIRTLGLCGSLRAQSSNAEVLHAFAAVAGALIEFDYYADLQSVPPFNPDWDTGLAPASVVGLRMRVRSAAAVVVSTPEYAHGVPGVLKNALDWLVGSGEFVDKPVAILKPSARGEIAIASLRETLGVMGARIVEPACITLPLTTNRIERGMLIERSETADLLRESIRALYAAIRGNDSTDRGV